MAFILGFSQYILKVTTLYEELSDLPARMFGCIAGWVYLRQMLALRRALPLAVVTLLQQHPVPSVPLTTLDNPHNNRSHGVDVRVHVLFAVKLGITKFASAVKAHPDALLVADMTAATPARRRTVALVLWIPCGVDRSVVFAVP